MKQTVKRIGLIAVILLLAISVMSLGFPKSGVTIVSAEVTVDTAEGELTLEETAEEVSEELPEEADEEPEEEAVEEVTEEVPEEVTEEPAEETTEEVTEEVEEGIEEVTEEVEEGIEEVTEEAPEKEIDYSALKVEVFTSMSEVVQKGEEVRLTSKLTGFEGIEYTLQWQYNDGSGWKDVEGATGESYTFAADAKTVNYMWRLTVAIK